jgi:hypothetical protein
LFRDSPVSHTGYEAAGRHLTGLFKWYCWEFAHEMNACRSAVPGLRERWGNVTHPYLYRHDFDLAGGVNHPPDERVGAQDSDLPVTAV